VRDVRGTASMSTVCYVERGPPVLILKEVASSGMFLGWLSSPRKIPAFFLLQRSITLLV